MNCRSNAKWRRAGHRVRTIPGLGLLAAVLSCQPAAPPPLGAGARIDYPTDTGPRQVAIADLNQDGRPDLVTLNNATSHVDEKLGFLVPGFIQGLIRGWREHQANEGSVSVRFGQASGGFGARTDYAVDRFPQTLALTDVTKDGRSDIIATSWGSHEGWEGTATVLAGRAGAGFGPRQDYPLPLVRNGTALADMTGDGQPDLVMPSEEKVAVNVLPGRAGAGFGPARAYALDSIGLESVTLADVNGDQQPDIILGGDFFSHIAVLLSQGRGGFGPPIAYVTSPRPSTVLVHDVTADGRPDLLTASTDLQSGRSEVVVLAGLGGGRFSSRLRYAAESHVYSLACGDVTGDGWPDVVTTNNDIGSPVLTSSLCVLPGRPGGGFGTSVRLLQSPDPRNLVLSDVNGDHRLDIMVLDGATSTVLVLTGPVGVAAKAGLRSSKHSLGR